MRELNHEYLSTRRNSCSGVVGDKGLQRAQVRARFRLRRTGPREQETVIPSLTPATAHFERQHSKPHTQNLTYSNSLL